MHTYTETRRNDTTTRSTFYLAYHASSTLQRNGSSRELARPCDAIHFRPRLDWAVALLDVLVPVALVCVPVPVVVVLLPVVVPTGT